MNSYEILSGQYIDILYHDELHAQLQSNVISQTPGEILIPSINKLLSNVQLTEDDVFVDLGSGLGKIVIQVFLQSQVKEAIGIEIVPAFHAKAMQASERLQHELPDFFAGNRKLTFLSGSFLDIPLAMVSVALINGVCFSPDILNALSDIIERTPTIHTVLSMRPLPTLQRLVFKKTMRVECSWDSALCYIYGM